MIIKSFHVKSEIIKMTTILFYGDEIEIEKVSIAIIFRR